MSEFPRTQKIAALVLVSAVVIVTLIVVASRDSGSSSVAAGEPDPNAEPTAIPVLERPRDEWSLIENTVRGAPGTTPPVACPFVDERVREPNNFLSLTPLPDAHLH